MGAPGGELTFTNARIVTRETVIDGALCIADGRIADVDSAGSRQPGALDLEGDLLLPGLVELHTDYLEKHFVPRPEVVWPSGLAAVLAHDVQVAAAGITTVFDSLTLGDYSAAGKRKQIFRASLAAINQAEAAGLTRAEHLLHFRCELSDPLTLDMFEPYTDEPLLRLASVMDHTPGERQWLDIEKFRAFHRDKKWTDEQLSAEVRRIRDNRARVAEPTRRRVLDLCRARGLPVASHDDTTEAHVDEAVADGLTICEFPTTRVAAARARACGMGIVMGAPNAVRDASHAGNVTTLDLAADGLIDALSSDYAPKSLLHAAFIVAERLGRPLPEAVALASAGPADMVGLTDRGEIVPGKRADLVRVRVIDNLPIVLEVWRQGRRVI